MNPFNILEIPRSSSKANITNRWRVLALKHHPNKGGTSTRFIKYNTARKNALKKVLNRQNNNKSVEVPVPVNKNQPKMSKNKLFCQIKDYLGIMFIT